MNKLKIEEIYNKYKPINVADLLKNRKVIFFEDTDFIEDGLYTFENIPLQYIKIEREITI